MRKDGIKRVKVTKKQVPISLATAQALLYLVKQNITSVEENIEFVNEVIADYWAASIPTDPDTREMFDNLNFAKGVKRNLSARSRKLAKISKELKEYLKGK